MEAMDREQVYNDFMIIVNEVGKWSPYQQAVAGPSTYMLFFEKIYDQGYSKGFKTGCIHKKQEIAKKN